MPVRAAAPKRNRALSQPACLDLDTQRTVSVVGNQVVAVILSKGDGDEISELY
jgi:hypothetical protein